MLQLPVLKLQNICREFPFRRKGREGKRRKEEVVTERCIWNSEEYTEHLQNREKRVCYCPRQPRSYPLSIIVVVMVNSLSHGHLGTLGKKSQQNILSQVLWRKERFFIKTKDQRQRKITSIWILLKPTSSLKLTHKTLQWGFYDE